MIHRFWMGPPREPDYGDAVRALHPDHLVTDWTPETLPTLLRPLCRLSDNPVKVSNLLRYALLGVTGGLWLDHDVEPYQRLTDSTEPWTASLNGHREGCALWFPQPAHPMLAECFARTRENPEVVGASVLQSVGKAYPDVLHEPAVLPYDALGKSMGIGHPLATHHWDTSKGIWT